MFLIVHFSKLHILPKASLVVSLFKTHDQSISTLLTWVSTITKHVSKHFIYVSHLLSVSSALWASWVKGIWSALLCVYPPGLEQDLMHHKYLLNEWKKSLVGVKKVIIKLSKKGGYVHNLEKILFPDIRIRYSLILLLYERKISTRVNNTGKMFVLIFPLKCILKQNMQVIISNIITFLMIF